MNDGSRSDKRASSARASVVVIGIGSPLRRDDAVGHAVIEALGERQLDDVELLSVHQLTPEVAVECADRRRVVFVDAAVDTDEVVVSELATDASGRLLTHHLGAAGLLGLAAGLGWAPEAATLVRIPVADLDIGTGLSDAAEAEVPRAVERIVALIDPTSTSGGHGED